MLHTFACPPLCAHRTSKQIYLAGSTFVWHAVHSDMHGESLIAIAIAVPQKGQKSKVSRAVWRVQAVAIGGTIAAGPVAAEQDAEGFPNACAEV